MNTTWDHLRVNSSFFSSIQPLCSQVTARALYWTTLHWPDASSRQGDRIRAHEPPRARYRDECSPSPLRFVIVHRPEHLEDIPVEVAGFVFNLPLHCRVDRVEHEAVSPPFAGG